MSLRPVAVAGLALSCVIEGWLSIPEDPPPDAVHDLQVGRFGSGYHLYRHRNRVRVSGRNS
jgi:hypothetical protein